MPSTWATRELPILRLALRRFDAGEQGVDLEQIRSELQMPGPQMRAAVTALAEASPPYIDVVPGGGWGDWRASVWGKEIRFGWRLEWLFRCGDAGVRRTGSLPSPAAAPGASGGASAG